MVGEHVAPRSVPERCGDFLELRAVGQDDDWRGMESTPQLLHFVGPRFLQKGLRTWAQDNAGGHGRRCRGPFQKFGHTCVAVQRYSEMGAEQAESALAAERQAIHERDLPLHFSLAQRDSFAKKPLLRRVPRGPVIRTASQHSRGEKILVFRHGSSPPQVAVLGYLPQRMRTRLRKTVITDGAFILPNMDAIYQFGCVAS